MSSGDDGVFWRDLRADLRSDGEFRAAFRETWLEVTGEEYAGAITDWENSGEAALWASAGMPRDEFARRAREIRARGRNDMDSGAVTEDEVRDAGRRAKSAD